MKENKQKLFLKDFKHASRDGACMLTDDETIEMAYLVGGGAVKVLFLGTVFIVVLTSLGEDLGQTLIKNRYLKTWGWLGG